MELIFVWTDSFRNFEDIGFNISNKHSVSFNSKKNNLTVYTKNTDIEIIFNKQIKNITGVIGQNSTGKSNLLDLICLVLKNNSKTIPFNFLTVFFEKNNDNQVKYYVYSNAYNTQNINSNISLDNISSIENLKDLNIVYISNVIDGRRHNFSKDIIDLSQNKPLRHKEKSNIYKQFSFLLSEMFEQVNLETPSSILVSTQIRNYNSSRINLLQETTYGLYKKVQRKYMVVLRNASASNHMKYSFRLSFFTYILIEATSETKRREYKSKFKVNPTKETIAELSVRVFKDIDEYDIKRLHDDVGKFIDLLFYEFTEINNITKKDYLEIYNFERAIPFLNPEQIKELKYSHSKHFYEIILNKKNIDILRKTSKIFDFNRVIDIEWRGISSGHKAFLNIFAQLYSVRIKINNRTNVLICIDEGDLYLHPIWQKEFLDRIISFITKVYKNNIQVILTSHSPFLVSDLPRDNLIFLKKAETGICKVISKEELGLKTFGANILDLYTDAFFLENTISTFALSKIIQAIEIAKSKNAISEDIDFARTILNVLGDKLISYNLNKIMKENDTNYQ